MQTLTENHVEAPAQPAVEGLLEMRTIPAKPEQHLKNPEVGEGLWQGDVGLQYLGTTLPDETVQEFRLLPDWLESVTTDRQLTPGSGVGSRHMLKADENLQVIEDNFIHPLVGCFLRLASPGRIRIDHPEHATICADTPGYYVVRFQRAPDLGETQRLASRTTVGVRRKYD